jgi:Flp pilus assembly protein TadB
VLGYGLKLAGAGIAIVLLGALAIILFEDLWLRVGLGAAMVVVFGAILLIAWRSDKKAKASRAGLERI